MGELLQKLSPDSLSALLLREEEADPETVELLELECKAAGIPLESVNYYWYKTEEGDRGYSFSINAKGQQATTGDLLEQFGEIVGKISPRARDYRYNPTKSNHRGGVNPLTHPHLMFIPMTDLHINKLNGVGRGEKFDHQAAYENIWDAVTGLLQKSAGYNIEKFLIWIGSDCLNSDGETGATTAGTIQADSAKFTESYGIAINMYINIINLLLPKAPVHALFVPGNHDRAVGFCMADAISRYFRNQKNITFDLVDYPRKVYKYHNVFIGSAHGDGPKNKGGQLKEVMTAEFSREWGETDFRYIYSGHLHAGYSEDRPGCRLRGLRSISYPGKWSIGKGYTGNMIGMDAYLISSHDGTEAVIPHNVQPK